MAMEGKMKRKVQRCDRGKARKKFGIWTQEGRKTRWVIGVGGEPK